MRGAPHAATTRGAFLATAAAFAFAPRAARARSGTRTIAIVGAGIAGLSAALALADRGVRATVYEAQARVGGRMHSERAFWATGQVSEYGAELIDSDHTTIRALAKRFGLTLADVLAGEPKGGEQTVFTRGRYVSEKTLFAQFRTLYPTLAEHLRAATPMTTYARSTTHGRELDNTSVAAWIDRYVRGGRRSELGEYLDLQYVAEYGIATERQSSLDMIYWLGRQPDYDATTGAFATLGPSDERYHIVGGNDRLPHAIAAALPAESLHAHHRLEAIARRSDGRVELVFATPTGSRTVVADVAIVTIPFSVLRNVDCTRAGFDARKRRAIANLGYGDHSKLIAQFDERYWRARGPWPGHSSGDLTYDGPFVQTWEGSRSQPGRSGLIVNFAAAGSSAALGPNVAYSTTATPGTAASARRFVHELDAPWPGARDHYTGKAALSHLTADPYARGSYSGWLVGQYADFAGYERVRQGNVLFAGEHCSLAFQGFMEGAAREGKRAAAEALGHATSQGAA